MAKYDNDQIIKLYNEGKTYKEIANIIGCSPNYISLKVSKLGITNRINKDKKKAVHVEKLEEKSKQLSKKELIEQFKLETAKLSAIVRKEKEIKDNDKKILYSSESPKYQIVEEKKEKPKKRKRTTRKNKTESKEEVHKEPEPQKELEIIEGSETTIVGEEPRHKSYTKNGTPTMKNFENNSEYFVDYFTKQVMDSEGNIYKVMSLQEIKRELQKDHGKK